MTASVIAHNLIDNLLRGQGGLDEEDYPKPFWGQGTPDGDLEPFKSAQKGSLYFQVNATDDTGHIWEKMDEAGDDDDWVKLVSRQFVKSKAFNIDNGSSTVDTDVFMFSQPIEILGAKAVYTEATDSAGAASAHVAIGTTAGGHEIVDEVALSVSKAIGSSQTLALVEGTVPANTMICITHHGVASAEGGEYVVIIEFVVKG